MIQYLEKSSGFYGFGSERKNGVSRPLKYLILDFKFLIGRGNFVISFRTLKKVGA